MANIFQPVFESIFTGLFGSDSSVARYFVELDNTLNSRYDLNAPFVASGDFEIKMDIYPVGTISNNALCGDSDTFIRLANASTVDFGYGAGLGLVINLSSPVEMSKLQEMKIVRTGLNIEVFKNGISVGVGVCSQLNNFTVAQIGAKDGANYFDGIISDVSFVDLSNNTNKQSYALNQATGTTETSLEGGNTITYVNIPESNRELYELADGGRWYGVNKWVAPYSVGSDWTDNVDGTFDVNGNTAGLLGTDPLLDDTCAWFIEFNWERSQGDLRLGNLGFYTTNGSGFYSVDYLPSYDDTLTFKRHFGTVIGTLSSVSMRKLIEEA